jgi:predicted transposase/invertase (TIGR01784 family)
MKRYLDPKNDLPFKRIFGEHPDLLMSFLNALMPLKEMQYIASLEYLPPELVPEGAEKKNSIVDVRCTDNYDRQFIVEMQMYWTKSFPKRMVYNASKAYIKRLNTGGDYNLLQPVYALGILDDVFDKKTSEYYHHYKSINTRNSDECLEEMEFVMIELPKFTPTSITEKKMAVLWLRFLREIKGDEYIEPAPELMENTDIRKAIELCEEGAFTEKERLVYEQYWDGIRKAKSEITDAWNDGNAKGEKRGIEIGKTEGIEIGKVEEKENIVVKGFENGVSLDIISSMTGLSNDEVNAILKKHKLI